MLICDIEANGLLDNATRLWVLCVYDTEEEHMYTYLDTDIEEGLQHLWHSDKMVWHNGIDYDLPLLQRLYNWSPRDGCKVVDTIILSRLLNPDRKGGHALADWARRLGGEQKVAQEQWEVWDSNMITRCQSDVRVTLKIYKKLQREMEGTKEDSLPWVNQQEI